MPRRVEGLNEFSDVFGEKTSSEDLANRLHLVADDTYPSVAALLLLLHLEMPQISASEMKKMRERERSLKF